MEILAVSPLLDLYQSGYLEVPRLCISKVCVEAWFVVTAVPADIRGFLVVLNDFKIASVAPTQCHVT